ncbi:hypothetical protein J2754_002349 [Halarchaeum solikamskense]|uniref:helix-turn-helix domain-containing protein n=1 Tax=Halarchaeum nitratireducens TaxID=489913 RepID=UPI001B3A9F92|nr:helix-turn-helix domain-containing protein [Halarchaeum solikamskense]MBP2252012.1 hypothetical protein [Halarchaeum solikamskense]
MAERQRVAFGIACYGGYFGWSRSGTAEEVAEAMGITAPTFDRHLREAERELFAGYAERRGTTGRGPREARTGVAHHPGLRDSAPSARR